MEATLDKPECAALGPKVAMIWVVGDELKDAMLLRCRVRLDQLDTLYFWFMNTTNKILKIIPQISLR